MKPVTVPPAGLLSLLSAVVFLPYTASAAILGQYSFGNPGQETTVETSPAFNPTVTGANLVASAITDPANAVGIEISSAATVPVGAPFLRLDPQGNSPDLATALTNNKYFQFTLTASTGFDLDLTSLTFDVARGGAGTPRGYGVRSSADNFATNLSTADVGTVRPAYTPISIPLTGGTFQDLPSITFRVYSYSPAGGSSVDYDNIVVNGTVSAVPEPATFAALALGTLALGFTRRRSVG
jgi:hypothetical protein